MAKVIAVLMSKHQYMSVLVWPERIKFALLCIPVSHGGGMRTLSTGAECSVPFISFLFSYQPE